MIIISAAHHSSCTFIERSPHMYNMKKASIAGRVVPRASTNLGERKALTVPPVLQVGKSTFLSHICIYENAASCMFYFIPSSVCAGKISCIACHTAVETKAPLAGVSVRITLANSSSTSLAWGWTSQADIDRLLNPAANQLL